MPLKGTVESFGISEIFQLVEHQGKTGTLQIRTSDGVAKLRFLNGKMVEAWPDKRTPAELIGSRLVRSGLINAVQLGHALEQQRHNLKRLGDILTSMGALRVSEFQEILALQHRETVYHLLQLKRGQFEFITESVEVEEGVSVPLDIGSLLMEGFRQIDEWPDLRKRIPSEKSVYGRVPGGAAGNDLEPLESRVLGLIDGVATVREVVDRCRAGDFLGWQAMANLFDRGLITPVGAVRKMKEEPKPVQAGRGADWVLGTAFVCLTGALLILFGPVRFTSQRQLGEAIAGSHATAASALERAEEWATRGPASWPPVTP